MSSASTYLSEKDPALNGISFHQTPVPGAHLHLHVHIPPTMDDSVGTTSAFEVLSTNEAGGTRYETSEAFGGIGAYTVKWFIGEKLQRSFEAMAEGLKAYAERKYGDT